MFSGSAFCPFRLKPAPLRIESQQRTKNIYAINSCGTGSYLCHTSRRLRPFAEVGCSIHCYSWVGVHKCPVLLAGYWCCLIVRERHRYLFSSLSTNILYSMSFDLRFCRIVNQLTRQHRGKQFIPEGWHYENPRNHPRGSAVPVLAKSGRLSSSELGIFSANPIYVKDGTDLIEGCVRSVRVLRFNFGFHSLYGFSQTDLSKQCATCIDCNDSILGGLCFGCRAFSVTS